MEKYYFVSDDSFWGREVSPYCMTEKEMLETCKVLSREGSWENYEKLLSMFHEATKEEIDEYGIICID